QLEADAEAIDCELQRAASTLGVFGNAETVLNALRLTPAKDRRKLVELIIARYGVPPESTFKLFDRLLAAKLSGHAYQEAQQLLSTARPNRCLPEEQAEALAA